MTIDEAIIRAVESAREDQQPFYVYHAGPLHFVSPTPILWGRFDAVVRPNGVVNLRHS